MITYKLSSIAVFFTLELMVIFLPLDKESPVALFQQSFLFLLSPSYKYHSHSLFDNGILVESSIYSCSFFHPIDLIRDPVFGRSLSRFFEAGVFFVLPLILVYSLPPWDLGKKSCFVILKSPMNPRYISLGLQIRKKIMAEKPRFIFPPLLLFPKRNRIDFRGLIGTFLSHGFDLGFPMLCT